VHLLEQHSAGIKGNRAANVTAFDGAGGTTRQTVPQQRDKSTRRQTPGSLRWAGNRME
jgi:hypothetical protein